MAASFASRGVNIECFLAGEFADDAQGRRGKFVAIIEADRSYAKVLKKGLQCLDVVHDVSEPLPLDATAIAHWRAAFGQLSRDCQAAVAALPT